MKFKMKKNYSVHDEQRTRERPQIDITVAEAEQKNKTLTGVYTHEKKNIWRALKGECEKEKDFKSESKKRTALTFTVKRNETENWVNEW